MVVFFCMKSKLFSSKYKELVSLAGCKERRVVFLAKNWPSVLVNSIDINDDHRAALTCFIILVSSPTSM